MAQQFKHSGKIGDCLYSLPTIRAMSAGKHTATLRLHTGAGSLFSEMGACELADLLNAGCRKLVHAVVFDQPTKGEIDLDAFRDSPMLWSEHLIASHARAQGLPAGLATDTPWLTVSEPRKVAPLVFARSTIEHVANPNFAWKSWVGKHAARAVFVGTRKEHAEFIDRFGFVPHYETPALIDLAQVVAGAEWGFVGNQSAPLAIAEAMGVPTCVECGGVTRMHYFKQLPSHRPVVCK